MTEQPDADLTSFDRIGFASGIYFSSVAKLLLSFADVHLPENKDVFFIATAGNPMQLNFNSISDVAKDKKCNERGRYQCKGYDTYGPFKLVGGIQKGHPNDEELKAAVDFYKSIDK